MMAGGFRIEIVFAEIGSHALSHSLGPADFRSANVSIWSREPMQHLDAHSVIIGRLFMGADRPDTLEHIGLDLVAEQGRALLSNYWGGYVFVHAGRDGVARVFRDPSGALPCYVKREADRIILAGDITELASPGSGRVDFDEVARVLSSGDARGRRTCFDGIDELIAGECLVVTNGAVALESWWTPWDHVVPRAGATFEDSAEDLRKTIQSSVGTWTRSYSSILLGVSGGLDSSIVAAAAAPAAERLTCLTLCGPDADGDERRYAAAMSSHLGLDLREEPRDLGEIDVDRAAAPNHAWPIVPLGRQTNEAIHDRIRSQMPIDAFFTGNGGDAVLCSLRSAIPFIDRVLAEGPSARLTGTLLDICLLTGVDRPTVLRHAWDRYRRARGRHQIKFNVSGLTPSAAKKARAAGVSHPWLLPPRDILPGKTVHAAYLMRAQKSIELYPRALSPPHVAPLISQPVMELCLSIPTWMWVSGGQNRAVARRAFAGELPSLVTTRTSKGGPGGFDMLIYRRNKDQLHERLRHGLLTRNGIFDPALLDVPEDPSWRGVERIQRILEFAAAENWVRWWSGS